MNCNTTHYRANSSSVPGDPTRRLLELIEETGPFGTLVLMGYDWDDKASWLHSLELFSKELMPALNKAVTLVNA